MEWKHILHAVVAALLSAIAGGGLEFAMTGELTPIIAGVFGTMVGGFYLASVHFLPKWRNRRGVAHSADASLAQPHPTAVSNHHDMPSPTLRKQPIKWFKRKRAQRHARSEDFRSFDVHIRNAIGHYVRTVPHSYTSNAELHAFSALHRAMCEGVLRVVGSKGEGGVPREISAVECSELAPRMVAISRTPAAREGARFDLIDESVEIKPLVETDKPIFFTELRVRSDDLYRLWPENLAEKAD